MRIRNLNVSELPLALAVFQGTLPYNKISISDALGASNRAFTIPITSADQLAGNALAVGLLGPLAFAFTTTQRPAGYLMNLGPSGFANAAATAIAPTLIHELTHVWQSYHSTFPTSYIFNSLWHQAVSGSNAYAYTPGQPWERYNVEQQAQIVEDWFRGGMRSSSVLFPYIQNKIRAAGP